MEFKGLITDLTDEVLPELSMEEEGPVVFVEDAPKEDDLVGLGTFRKLPGIFGTGAPLPAMLNKLRRKFVQVWFIVIKLLSNLFHQI